MKMSTRGRYALILMIDLAKSKDLVSLKTLSEKENISIKYLEKIVNLLVKADLVKAIHGKNGGYKLVKKPEEYNIGDILRVTEGPMKPAECIDSDNCDKKDTCTLYGFWSGLYNDINSYVDNKTLKDLL